jgi:VanZ family protein
MVVAAFTAYPFLVLSRLRSKLKDKEVRSAFKVFALAFSTISITLFFAIGLSSVGYSLRSSANILSVFLIFAAVRAFRKPTFLKSFLGVVPSLESSPLASHVDQMILFYGADIDKFVPIAKYIIDAAGQDNRVYYFHTGNESQTRQDLIDQGVDVRQYMLKGLLRIVSLSTLYQKGSFDDTAIDYCEELAREARALDKAGLRIIIDFDDLIMRPIQKFIAHLTDNRWASPDHYVHVLMTFRSGAFPGEAAIIAELGSKVRILDLAETMNAFSRTVGLSHAEFAGKKILLEFDPRSDYERILSGILAESASNFERTVIFTRRGNPIHSLAQRQVGAKLFVLTSKVSYPKKENDNRVLLPAYDTSLVLDALNRTIEAYQGSSFTIIFDDISHFIFTLGLDRAYSFVRQAMELVVSSRISVIFSINSKAHDEKALATFESLFDIEIVSEKGERIPEVRRKLVVSSS